MTAGPALDASGGLDPFELFGGFVALGFGMVFLLVLLGFAAIVGVLVFALRARRRRVAALTKFAAAQGWQLQEFEPGFVGRWPGAPFETGRHRRAADVLTGRHRGHHVAVFQYSYETYSGTSHGSNSTKTHRYAVHAVKLASVLPGLVVGRESFLDRLPTLPGHTGVEFENHQFNSAFTVRTSDRKFAYDVIHPRMMELLLQRPAMQWRIHGDDLLCWTRGEYPLQEVLGRLDLLIDIAAAIPSFVWTEHEASR